MMGENDPQSPYADATRTNTGSGEWLAGYDDIKADFGQLYQYAANMQRAAFEMMGDTDQFRPIPELTRQAFMNKEYNFPEGTLAGLFGLTNFNDLSRMLADLGTGLLAMAYAAQTVSDVYDLTEHGNGADINSLVGLNVLDYAFGVSTDRPQGLSKDFKGQTMQQLRAEQGGQAGNAAALGSFTGGNMSVTYSGPADHSTKVTTVTYDDGSQLKVYETVQPDGSVTSYYQVYDASSTMVGETRRTTTTSGGTTTTVTETKNKDTGEWHNSSAKAVTQVNTPYTAPATLTTVTTYDADGNAHVQSSETVTHNADGSVRTQTTEYGKDPKGNPTQQTNEQLIGDNDTDTSDQDGEADPWAVTRDDYSHNIRPEELRPETATG